MKLVLLGEGRVGKTSIVNRWVNNVFDPDQPSTTDAQMYVKKKLFVDGKSVEIALWDTAGQERYHALGPLYYRNADGALLVYDCTDEDTFDRVRRWIKELQKAANPNIQIVICGNKADREKERQVPEAKADNFARKYSAEHFSTSAKTNLGVDEAFLHLIRSVVAVKEGRLSGNGIDDNDDLFGNMTMGDDDTGSASTKKKSSKKKSGGRMKIVEDDSNNNDSYDVGDQSGYGSGPAVSASGTQIGGSRVNHLGGRSTAETDDWMPKGGDDASSANYNRKQNNNHDDDDDDNGGYSSFTRGGGRYGDDDEEDHHHNKASNNNKKKSSTSTKRKQQEEESDQDDNNGETDYSIDDGSNWNPGSSSKSSKPPQKSTPASQVLQQQQQQQKPKTINLADAPKKTAGGGQQQDKKGCSC